MDYNIALANRFVSDYKLPIPITNNEKIFLYYLTNLETDFKAFTKYNELVKIIEANFDNNPQKFLDEYYQKREDIMHTMLENPAYQEFNNMDMNKFSIKEKINIRSSNIYNYENDGKVFLSVDLCKANFQALKYVNPDIVYNQETYEDFINLFTNLDYIKKSKYTRQIIFGKLNPKRHITVEKYITNEIRKIFKPIFEVQFHLNLKSFNNDELVYEVPKESHFNNLINNDIIEKYEERVKNELGIDVNIEIFRLKKIEINKLSDNEKFKTVYEKQSLVMPFETELKCVPQPLFMIIYKLYKNKPINSFDKQIIYENVQAEIKEDFYIKTTE